MKINYREFLGHLFTMFFIMIGSNVFVDAVAGDDVFRIFKLKAYQYIIIFLMGILGAYCIYFITKKSAEQQEE